MIELEKHPVETEAGDQFRECIIMTASKSEKLKMRELLEMSKEIGFLVDEPQHMDYFDPFAIMLVELFTEYQEYGKFPIWTYNMDDVKEIVIDEETKEFLLQILNDIYDERKIETKERDFCIQWKKTGMTEVWKRYIESLIHSLKRSIPYKETEDEIAERKEKEENEKKSGKGVVFVFVLMFGMIFLMGSYILYMTTILLKTGKILQGVVALLFSGITLFFSGKLFLGFFKELFK
ncbi:hypothetical protein [Fusobacterium sp.]|uniref:hypothetical protein n=1 Tax=Fusobacterium sp. TaxID=68766 RepID=UPI0028FFF2F6|nr:hypothetical protein [Fusobacterium sp.]MDU1909685.1 hypothetical protein [Fusobacterium sp.]